MKEKKPNSKGKARRVLGDYDAVDTADMIDLSKLLKFEDIGLRLPEVRPTQVISIRLPSPLLNELKAISSEADIPYQALIKLFLAESILRFKKKSAA
jgi:predicted DNA binding CopG/RHH family protein